jgi:hypothetical protein
MNTHNRHGCIAPQTHHGRNRFSAGRVYPRACSDPQGGAKPSLMQTECLLRSRLDPASVDVRVRFLHPSWCELPPGISVEDSAPGQSKPRVEMGPVTVDGRQGAWLEGVEREVRLASVWMRAGRHFALQRDFSFPASTKVELFHNRREGVNGMMVRRQEGLNGKVEVQGHAVGAGLLKLRVRILNETPLPGAAFIDWDLVILRSIVGAHIILQTRDGAFVSLSRPGEHRELAETCENIGILPVLVADADRDVPETVLSIS